MIGKKLTELRKMRAITQENLAERLDVSRQTVQKWESDAAIPDVSKLIMLSELFGITMEELLGMSVKPKKNMCYPSDKLPDYENMGGAFYEQLSLELQQSAEEGQGCCTSYRTFYGDRKAAALPCEKRSFRSRIPNA